MTTAVDTNVVIALWDKDATLSLAASVGQNFRTPYYLNYTLQTEKGFGNAAVLQVGYVGSQGRKLTVTENINQNGVFNTQYPNVGSIKASCAYGLGRVYLTVRLHLGPCPGRKKTQFRAVIPLDSVNLKQEYGNSDFDTRHNFTAYWTYDISGSSHGQHRYPRLAIKWVIVIPLRAAIQLPWSWRLRQPAPGLEPGEQSLCRRFAQLQPGNRRTMGKPGCVLYTFAELSSPTILTAPSLGISFTVLALRRWILRS